ncbi:MAG: 30S ribosomal protein S20 [Candidatus Woykebacteria bacterium]
MPLTKSAIKKMRQDEKRRQSNRKRIAELKSAIKNALEKKSLEDLKKAQSLLDKAAKRGLIHKKTASRRKSSITRKAQLNQPKKSSKKKSTKTRP